MKKNIKSIALFTFLVAIGYNGIAQTTGQKIGTNPTIKDPSALLELEAVNKGLLVPRVALTSTILATPVISPAHALTVFNTATAGTAPNDVIPGYYYWRKDDITPSNSKWIRLLDGLSHTLSNPINQITSIVNGISATAPAVNTVVNTFTPTITTNNLVTSVNGVPSTAIDLTPLKIEPWQVQTTTDKATLNNQHIYQMGSVAVAKNLVYTDANGKRASLDVSGAIRSGALPEGIIGDNSVALGARASASNSAAVALGAQVYADGMASMAFGFRNYSQSLAETAMGAMNIPFVGDANNWIDTDPLFTIGNANPLLPTALRRNGLTMLKNANTGIGILAAGSPGAAKPTEMLDIGSQGVRIRDINTATYAGNPASDRIVVADANGVLKTVASSTFTGIRTEVVSYTAALTDETILVNANLGLVKITLPAANTVKGKRYNVKKIDVSANDVNVVATSGTIDGNAAATGVTNNVVWQGWTFQSDGTNWFIISRI